jgi:hypothetical protein
MKQFLKDTFTSLTFWIWAILLIGSTILLALGLISPDNWLVFQPVIAGIALTKRAITQAIQGGGTPPGA